MVGAPLNMLDVSVLLIVTLSTVVAFFRGFIRELLSLGAWVGAAIATIYFLPHATELMKHHMRPSQWQWAPVIAGTITYIVALMIISIFNAVIIRYVKSGNEVGILDNFLGLIFGAMRGMFIVSLGYLIVSATGFIPKENEPDWIKTSFTRDYLQMGANALTTVAPKYLSEMEVMVKKEADEAEKKKQEMDQAAPSTPSLTPSSAQPRGNLF